MTNFYDQALKPVGISISQYSLLINVNRLARCGTGELASQVKLEKSTLVRTLRPLLKTGLIRDCSPAGNRKRQLELTPAGQDILNQAMPLWEKTQDELRAKLGKSFAELMAFFEIMDKV